MDTSSNRWKEHLKGESSVPYWQMCIYIMYSTFGLKKEIKKNCDGESYLIRFADDFVAIFRYARDAKMYYRKLRERLAKFSLELAEDQYARIVFAVFRDRWAMLKGIQEHKLD